jgi:hypothetical protein
MNESNTVTGIEPFPPKAQKLLDSFYDAKNLSNGSAEEKLKAIKAANGLSDATIAADGGFDGAESELRATEFYILTKAGVI